MQERPIDCFCCRRQLIKKVTESVRCTVCKSVVDEVSIWESPDNKITKAKLTLAILRQTIRSCKENFSKDHPALPKSKISHAYFEPVKNLIEAVFSCPDNLSNSFSDGKQSGMYCSGLALNEVRESYRLLATLPVEIIRTMMKSIEKLLIRPGRPFARKRDIKWLLVLLENPLLAQNLFEEEATYHHNLLSRLFGIISCLNDQLHHYFVSWVSKFPNKIFLKKIDLVNHFISRCIKYHHTEVLYQSDWRVSAASRVMGLLFAAQTFLPEIQIKMFYNSNLDNINLILDYDSWQMHLGKFSFCQYPFLLSLKSKLFILKLDAHRQMEKMLKNTINTISVPNLLKLPFLVMYIRRDNLISDSLDQISLNELELKKKLVVKFVGEEGVDAGGLTKEWFMLLVRELFHPKYGMFVWEEESQLFWFNPCSLESQDQYYLVGIVIGLAIYNSIVLDIPLPTACFKKLFNIPVTLNDLLILRPSVGKNLQKLLDYTGDDVEAAFGLVFEIQYEEYGSIVTYPLSSNGSSITVTNHNREEFVQSYSSFVLSNSIDKQFECFKKGFHLVCGGNALSLLNPEEVELLVRGDPEPFQIAHLRAETELEGFFQDDSIIRFFWEVLESFSSLRRRQFLAFATGSCRLPFSSLSEFTLTLSCSGEDSDSLPIAHTCFNQLCFPRYSSKAKLEKKLVQAIDETEGFELT